VTFPCSHLPDDPGVARLLGLYPQRQESLWMQRIKVLGGVLTSEQWRMLGRIAEEVTPAAPLHLTTRQDIELHDLTAETVPRAQKMAASVRLSGLGAGGDTFRNITVCPCSGTLRGTVDLFALARKIRAVLESEEGIFALPRKFKISLSCSPTCGQPWLNDLGFVVECRNSQRGFHVIGAGSLGPNPATGITLFHWLPPHEVLPATVSAVRVFAVEGDRINRNRARLRHVRQRMGDTLFLRLFEDVFESVKRERTWPEINLPKTNGRFTAFLTLTFANGDIIPAAAEGLAQLAAREDLCVRIANHHRIHVFARATKDLREAIEVLQPLAQAVKPQPAVVACPGTRWCKRALADTNRMADRVRSELGTILTPGMTVCISGCPNSCAHSAVADIGLIGGLSARQGHKQQIFDLLAGGGMGRNDKLADLIASRLTPGDALREMDRHLSKVGTASRQG